MSMGGVWPSNSWQTAACNPYQTHSYGKGQPSDTNHKLLLGCRRLAPHGGCAAPSCWQLRPPGRWQTISPRLWWLQVFAFLSILQMLINTQGDDKRGAGLLPQGGGPVPWHTERPRACPGRHVPVQIPGVCEYYLPCNPLVRSSRLPSCKPHALGPRVCL